LSHVVRTPLVMRIGSLVRDKQRRGAPESEYHRNVAACGEATKPTQEIGNRCCRCCRRR
jgi:hypothetical protein